MPSEMLSILRGTDNTLNFPDGWALSVASCEMGKDCMTKMIVDTCSIDAEL